MQRRGYGGGECDGRMGLCIIFQCRVPCLHLLSRNPCTVCSVLRRRYQPRDKGTVETSNVPVRCAALIGRRRRHLPPALCLCIHVFVWTGWSRVHTKPEHCGGSRGRCHGESGLTSAHLQTRCSSGPAPAPPRPLCARSLSIAHTLPGVLRRRGVAAVWACTACACSALVGPVGRR
jgi:hypothetical protein